MPKTCSLRPSKETLKNTHLLPIPDTGSTSRVLSAENCSCDGGVTARIREIEEEKKTERGDKGGIIQAWRLCDPSVAKMSEMSECMGERKTKSETRQTDRTWTGGKGRKK